MQFGLAQEGLVELRADMFQENKAIDLSHLEGWRFKAGNRSEWAQPDWNTADWKKITPSQLAGQSKKGNSQVEGWFRIRLRLKEDLEAIAPGLHFFGWAYREVYLDGKLIRRDGQQGNEGHQFWNPFQQFPTPIALKNGKDHTLAIHWVKPIPYFRQEVATVQHLSEPVIQLTTPDFNRYLAIKNQKVYQEISTEVAINGLIFAILWLLVFLNPEEKNRILIALGGISCLLLPLIDYILIDPEISWYQFSVLAYVLELGKLYLMTMIFFITAKILKN